MLQEIGKCPDKGLLLGVVDHFADGPVKEYSPTQEVHFPQHDFVQLLRRKVLASKFCYLIEGRHADVREIRREVTALLTDNQTGRRQQLQTQFLVGVDGAHSTTRQQLGIELISENGILQHLINVHFFSLELSEWLRSRIPAMLYFVYSSAGVAVLVAHAFKRGEFVAQIPFFPPHQQAKDFDEQRCIALLRGLAGRPISINIRSIRTWRMGVWEVSRFRSRRGRCFLIGPPHVRARSQAWWADASFLAGRQGWSKNFSPGFTIFDDRRRPLTLLRIVDRWRSGIDI